MNKIARGRAFALIEVILVVAAISLLSAAGYYTVAQVKETARENKLEADVANLNNAVQMYTASGGDLSEATTVGGVLNKLKTRANADGVAKQMGMKGSFIDPRTIGISQSDGEAGSTQSRAIWNASAQKFEVKSSGAGVKAFGVDNSLSAGEVQTEERSRTLTAADVNSENPVWVWDHTDVTPAAVVAGQVPGQSPSTPPGDPEADDKMTLSAPTFSPQGGNRSVSQLYDLFNNDQADSGGNIIVTFSSNNPGVACAVMPGDTVMAPAASVSSPSIVSGYYTKSLEPDVWEDSDPAAEQQYSVTPLQLEVNISPSVQSPGPYQLGVSPTSGSFTQATFTATITNGSSYPEFQPSGFATLRVATGSSSFSGGVTSLSETQTLSTGNGWDTSSGTPSLLLRAYAEPTNSSSKLFTASGITTSSLSGAKETLSVSFSPAGGDIAQSGTVTLTASSSPTSNTFPQGYSIRFTSDGSTPTINSTQYSGGGIVLGNTGTITLKAAAFPPTQHTAWFDSPVASATFTVPANQGGGGSIAGVMVSAIAKMNGEIIGDTQLLKNNAFNWNGSTDFVGDLYLPGTPTFRGNTFQNNPGSITIVTGTGSVNPAGWEFRIDNGSITGKIYTRTDPDYSGLSDKDQAYIEYILGINPNLATNSLTVITTGTTDLSINGNKTFSATTSANFDDVTVGGTLKLGNPNTTTYYNFNSLTVNGSGQVELLGPVVLSFKNSTTLNNVVGTSVVVSGTTQALHPDWLTIYSQSSLTINGGGGIYGKKIVSNSSVEINGFITLSEGIIANTVGVNGGGRLTVGHFDE